MDEEKKGGVMDERQRSLRDELKAKVRGIAKKAVCAWDGCGQPKVGKSKYCREHREEAHNRWKERMQAKKGEKEENDE